MKIERISVNGNPFEDTNYNAEGIYLVNGIDLVCVVSSQSKSAKWDIYSLPIECMRILEYNQDEQTITSKNTVTEDLHLEIVKMFLDKL